MITFLLSLAILIIAYFTYGRFIDMIVFKSDSNRPTPVVNKQDGVDYIPLPTWKIFMIQFLNIAGLGPIFGAIMGAKFGASAYLWIVFGCIFCGAMHDYISAMISVRHEGASLTEIIGKYLGRAYKNVSIVFIAILMILVGVVFTNGPADLLHEYTIRFAESIDLDIYKNEYLWVGLIFIYYLLASILPIDKLIAKIYPIFSVALIFMALGVLYHLILEMPDLPEILDGISNTHPKAETTPIFPMLFITIACGALSGFHATQSPMMARCIKNEKLGRGVFFGAMIVEGIVALIWAAAANYFYAENGMKINDPTLVIDFIVESWFGVVGTILAILGVVFAPISTGDTAIRSLRLIIADRFNIDQSSIIKRLYICIPIFIVVAVILFFSIANPDGFNIIWRYFSWFNQLLAVLTLWTITVYLFAHNRKWHFVSLIPALFMTTICTLYFLVAKEGLRLDYNLSVVIACVNTVIITVLFYTITVKRYLKTIEDN